MTGGEYLAEQAVLPYCKGCGHGVVLRALDRALTTLTLSPEDLAIVSDIGCVGLADSQIGRPHTIHTTHGRSTAFATGLAVADRALGAGRLKTIVLIGDGGAMIGLNHLIYGALLDPDVTVLVHNNFLFGMTGGQGSAFSPLGFVTRTTPAGNAVPPLDLGEILVASRARFVARCVATDRELPDLIARAIATPGFAVVEALELCTAYGTTRNALTGPRIRELAATAGYRLGVLRDEPRPSPALEAAVTKPAPTARPMPSIGPALLDRQMAVVVAGTAGERVQTAATLLAEGAILAGLSATQKNDNPVTQGTGFSLSEVLLSPDEILFTGIARPDVVIAASQDGAAHLADTGVFARCDASTVVLADADVALPELPAPAVRLPIRKAAGPKLAATTAIAWWLADSRAVPAEAVWEAAARKFGAAEADAMREAAARLADQASQ